MLALRPVWAYAVAALLLAACGRGNTLRGDGQLGQPVVAAGGTYRNISVAELQTMLTSKDFPFVNVHIPFEGNIAPTDLSIPYNQIEQQLDRLPADTTAKIVLYCRTGRMSEIAAEALVRRGYTNVFNLDGGMVAWEQAGLPLDRQ